MAFYKQSTAYTRMFKMIDSADHFSKKTGLTCTVNLSKAGAAFGAAGGTVTEVANGWYKVALSTTDTNTVGDLAFYITATGADDTDFVDQVWVRDLADLAFPATSGRSMVVDASGLVDANTVKLGPTGSGTAQTAKDVGGAVPAAAAGASGGLLISGSNSGTTTLGALTITGATTHTGNVSMAAGCNITQSSSNTSALVITGNGTGHGIISTSGSGATGDGIKAISAATNGNGMTLTKTGSGSDLNATVTPLTLAKTTNITGFNDIAATAIVSSGAITTSGGAVSTVTTVTNQLTAAAIATGVWTDTTAGDFTTALSIGKSLMNGVALGTGLTVANLTNAPTAGDFTATMKTSIGTAVAASAVASVTGNVGGNVTGSVGSVVGLTASNLDATISSRLASASYTAPDNTSITAIKAKTDSLTFTVANQIDANTRSMNSVAVIGAGTSGNLWRA